MRNKIIKTLYALVVFSFLGNQISFAGEIDDLKAMITDLKSSYETKIQALEEKINALEAKQNQQPTPDLAEVKAQIKEEIKKENMGVEYVGRHNAPVGEGGVLVKNVLGSGNVSLGGYIDMEYLDRNTEESTFRQHRLVLNIGAQATDNIRFNSEIEFEYGGPNAPNSDGEVKVEQAYIDYLVNEHINMRAGAILSPFGRYNLYHDSDLQNLTDRPIVARDVIPTTWTEAGYGFFGSFNPVFGSFEDLELNYEAYVVNGLDTGFSDTGFGGARSSLKTDNNDNKAVVGRLVASPALGQEVGVSGYWGEYNGNGDAISGVGADTLTTFGPFKLINEYAYFNVEEDPTTTSDVANWFQGAYSELSYRFWPSFLNETFLGRGFSSPTFALVGRYDWALIHDDSDSTIGNNEENRYTLGLNYRPIDNFVVKFEYQINHTENETLEAGDGDGFLTSVSLGF